MNLRQILVIAITVILVACSKQSNSNTTRIKTDEERRTNAEQAGAKIKDAAEATKDYLVVQVDEFQEKTSKRLSELDTKIEAWRNRHANDSDANLQAERDRTSSSFQQKRSEIQAKLDAYRDASPEQRDSLRSDINNSINDYERSVDLANTTSQSPTTITTPADDTTSTVTTTNTTTTSSSTEQPAPTETAP